MAVIKWTAAVRTGMAETKSMAKLVKMAKEVVAINCGAMLDEKAFRIVDVSGNDSVIYQEITRSIVVFVVIECDVRVIMVNQLEFDTSHVGPGLKSPLSKL